VVSWGCALHLVSVTSLVRKGSFTAENNTRREKSKNAREEKKLISGLVFLFSFLVDPKSSFRFPQKFVSLEPPSYLYIYIYCIIKINYSHLGEPTYQLKMFTCQSNSCFLSKINILIFMWCPPCLLVVPMCTIIW